MLLLKIINIIFKKYLILLFNVYHTLIKVILISVKLY